MYRTEKAKPLIRWQKFNGKDVECFEVKIDGKDYRECVRAADGKNFDSNSKPGDYGAGCGKTPDDPYKPARTGFLGQMAFGKLTDLPVDTERRKCGDKYDFLVGEYKIDIKCTMWKRGYALVYQKNEWGTEIPLNKDLYVCSYIKEEDRLKEFAIVVFTGFAWKKEVERCEIKSSKWGKHSNYELPFAKLRSMSKLMKGLGLSS